MKARAGGKVRGTCLECLGLLITETPSVKALCRSGLSTILRSKVEPADGWPRVSQLTGISCQVCLIFISPQGTTGVATSVRGAATRIEEHNEPEVRHEFRRSAGMCKFERYGHKEVAGSENMTGKQCFYGAFRRESRGWCEGGSSSC